MNSKIKKMHDAQPTRQTTSTQTSNLNQLLDNLSPYLFLPDLSLASDKGLVEGVKKRHGQLSARCVEFFDEA